MSAVLHRCRSSKLFRIDLRHLSSSNSSPTISPTPIPHQNPANFKSLASIPPFRLNPRNFLSTSPYWEIAPPGTVKRDLSPLANETRQAVDDTMRSMYGLSRAAAALAAVQIGIGGWIYYRCTADLPSSAAAASCAVTVAFPMYLAFSLRRRMRPIFFGRKMEEEGRMKILKMNLQVAKSVDLLFVRLRSVSCISAAGLAAGLVYAAVSSETKRT